MKFVKFGTLLVLSVIVGGLATFLYINDNVWLKGYDAGLTEGREQGAEQAPKEYQSIFDTNPQTFKRIPDPEVSEKTVEVPVYVERPSSPTSCNSSTFGSIHDDYSRTYTSCY